jgi:hypothetical protein
MQRCAASFVIAAYNKYASFLRICAPCLRTFYKAVRNSTFYESIKFDGFVKNPHAALALHVFHDPLMTSRALSGIIFF